MIRRDSFVDFMTWCGVGGILIFLGYAFCTSQPSSSHPPFPGQTNAEPSIPDPTEHLFEGFVVVRVMDGDSMIAKRDDLTIEIRVAGIDCPEYQQPYFAESKRTTEKLCLGRKIVAKRRDTDRYGRIVSDVYVDSVDVSEQLLRSGMAWHFKKYDASERLANLERIARESRVGLWSQAAPVPPWEYRDTARRREELEQR